MAKTRTKVLLIKEDEVPKVSSQEEAGLSSQEGGEVAALAEREVDALSKPVCLNVTKLEL